MLFIKASLFKDITHAYGYGHTLTHAQTVTDTHTHACTHTLIHSAHYVDLYSSLSDSLATFMCFLEWTVVNL